jgi:membrane protein
MSEATLVTSVPATKPNRFIYVAKNSVTKFLADECTILAAAIVYYFVQSLVPLLLGFVAVASLVLQDASSRQNFIDGVKNVIPADVANTINLPQILDSLAASAGGIGVISILLLLWTGSGIFAQFMLAINKAFGIPKDKRNFLLKLGLRLLMLVVVGGLLVAAFGVTFAVQLVLGLNIDIMGVRPANFSFILNLISFVMPLLIQTGVLMFLYKLSPNRKGLKWKYLFFGGLVAALLLEGLKWGFSIYINVIGAVDNAAKTYGALGGIIVFLLFIYLISLMILLGAELASVLHNYDNEFVTVVKAEESTIGLKNEEQTPKIPVATAIPKPKKSFAELLIVVILVVGVSIGSLLFGNKRTG